MSETTNEPQQAKGRKETRISIRFPFEVLTAMRALAQQHERSFNGELIWALREYIERYADQASSKQGKR